MDNVPVLKPCPFCGSTAVVLVDLTVRCGNCTAVGPFGVDAGQAIKRWNERMEGRTGNDIKSANNKTGGL
jgi:Lar family restriction alleviation protein